ncbi:hypothetical protein LUZ62_089408 [Rhynchospora pubera]|uniref:Reverse transcriptase domain-containing protein n=1 Tax=Rhynchospora pubera TaxID=906938 RepID=A0AAV8CLQ6_9POAL|nr:hypothetical protein LUZ62_089408 [Rhynchospora pubera]
MRRYLHSAKVNLAFISETRCGVNKAVRRISSLPLKNFEIIPSVESSGGLWLLWDDSVQVTILERSHYFVFAQITQSQLVQPWILGAIYGDPHGVVDGYIWDRIVDYAVNDQRPLCVIGDLNSIGAPNEKLGGSSRIKPKHRRFQNMMVRSGLVDLGYHGPAYTWSNNQDAGRLIMQRLDRAMATVPWCSSFPKTKIFHLPRANSDHSPILLSQNPVGKVQPKSFRFENWWLLKEGFDAVCRQAIASSDLQWNMVVQNLSRGVKKWLKSVPTPNLALHDLEEQLLLIQQEAPTEQNLRRDKELQHEYSNLLLQAEAYWAQRSRLKWAFLGDSNTNFYHSSVIHRRKINAISSLKLEDGSVATEEGRIRRAFVRHFKDIYCSRAMHRLSPLPLSILGSLPLISPAQAFLLAALPSENEIVNTVFAINPDKAPGPDGVNGKAVQTFWAEFAPCVMHEVNRFFLDAYLDPKISTSNMVLVPKVDHPSKVTDYRPISVCNFLYKVISKLLANRMKSLVSDRILSNQSAFTPGREITENIIILREVMDTFHKRGFTTHAFAFKCDLSKAFDRMEWDFVLLTLTSHGFPSEFVQWIRACLVSARFSILLNGRADGFISPSRGLRQGCALSSYLFILAMDVLARMLEHERMLGHIHGVKLARNAPPLTSILFADDLVIFGHASIEEVLCIQRILNVFCECSGQQIGHDKSRIWFSKSTPQNVRQCIATMLNALPGDDSQVYLGVPVVASRPKDFVGLVDRVQAKLNSWSSKLLSQAGKVALIKAVIEPMVLYGVAGGPLPDSIAHKLNQKIRAFFWGSNGTRKLQLMSWATITRPKMHGGLGLRDVTVINGAAVMKVLWKLASKEHEGKLWTKILKAKYLSRKTLWETTHASAGTKLWKAVVAMREVLKPNLVWQLGSGDKCLVFGDPWFEFWQQFTPQSSRQRNMLLRELIDSSSNQWRTRELISCFGFHGAVYIACRFPQPPTGAGAADRLIFKPTQNGKFSFKGAVRLLMGLPRVIETRDRIILKAIWHTKGIIPRVRLFLWKLFHDRVPSLGTYASIMRRNIPSCQICDSEEESGMHVLFKCPSARSFWLASYLGLQSDLVPGDPKQLLQFIAGTLQDRMFVGFANHLWALWKHRCGVVHEGKSFNALSALRIANSYDALSGVILSRNLHSTRNELHTDEQMQISREGLHCWVDGSYDGQGWGGWAYLIFEKDTLKMYGAEADYIVSPFHGELNAISSAMKAVQKEGWLNCVFHSDCQVLCNLLNGKADMDVVPWQCFSQALDLVRTFKELNLTCVFCPRNLNIEAHCIASYARVNRTDLRGFTFPLPCALNCN